LAQANKTLNGKTGTPLAAHMIRGLREGALIVSGATALYLFASLGSYSPKDPGWSHSETAAAIRNAGGVVGAWFADIFLYLFGYLAYLVPVGVAYWGWLLFMGRKSEGALDLRHGALRALGFLLTLGAGTGLAKLHFADFSRLPVGSGGVLGDVVGNGLMHLVNPLGSTLFLLALFLTGVTLLTSLSWLALMDGTGRITLKTFAWLRERFLLLKDEIEGRRARAKREAVAKVVKKKEAARLPVRIEPVIKPVAPVVSNREEKERQVPLFDTPVEGSLPPLSLLDPAEPRKGNVSSAALEAVSRQVELKLADFGIEARVVAVHPGPVVTRYELDPAPGVKSSQISNLSKDLARSLSAISVRVVEVIPGKSTIGLEIPNEVREIVRLSEVIKSPEYENANSALRMALGVDIAGHPVVADLAKMPHLLVAGTTGSGKSVGLNAMVLSMLYNATPKELRMIMIDPKMLELSVYEGIPHLLAPVVTDMKEAANALRWCVAEMERRYKLMATLAVRNVAGYNRKVSDAIESKEPIKDPLYTPLTEDDVRYLEPMPQIVVVVDELADMMMTVGKKVEELIARLAQKARAAGMHLILATQRPSVDVLTGLIKANIPTRMAFQVSAKVDSRTILDQSGAEQLLGHGDMLYLPPGSGFPMRIHGAFVSDAEVHRVVQDWRKRGAPEYVDEILEGPPSGTDMGNFGGGGNGGEGEGEQDPLYDEAVRIVTESRKASISGVQRRLKIGYNRAARMVEEMEAAGVVGPLQSNGSREVLAPPPVGD
jgi:S-DNA-T family DNA segregation ATPase FtsK/SpoIIIE